jgi:hypothetical protein
LSPGVYTFGTDVEITGDIVLRGKRGRGKNKDVFIIQISGNLNIGENFKMFLKNGARANNIFWQVAGNVYVGVGAHMEGTL